MTAPSQTIADLVADLRAKREAATKGAWVADTEDGEGSYGSGDDVHEGFKTYAMFANSADRAVRLFGSENSDGAEVQEEFGSCPESDGYFAAWDEVARRNFEFIEAAHAHMPALLAALEAQAAEIARKDAALRAGLAAFAGMEDGDGNEAPELAMFRAALESPAR